MQGPRLGAQDFPCRDSIRRKWKKRKCNTQDARGVNPGQSKKNKKRHQQRKHGRAGMTKSSPANQSIFYPHAGTSAGSLVAPWWLNGCRYRCCMVKARPRESETQQETRKNKTENRQNTKHKAQNTKHNKVAEGNQNQKHVAKHIIC